MFNKVLTKYIKKTKTTVVLSHIKLYFLFVDSTMFPINLWVNKNILTKKIFLLMLNLVYI